MADSGIAGVGEGAGLAIAETGEVVFVAAESLVFFVEPVQRSVSIIR